MPPALEAPEEPHGATCGDGQLLRSGKGRHEDPRRALEWADVHAPSGGTNAKRWSLRANARRNSHCAPTPHLVPLQTRLQNGSVPASRSHRAPGSTSYWKYPFTSRMKSTVPPVPARTLIVPDPSDASGNTALFARVWFAEKLIVLVSGACTASPG